jgi:DNA helicase-2/ATP-dependent DNA helicase PcrA
MVEQMADIGVSELSDEQRAVVDSDDRFLVVLASAGGGKTEVVAQRVERLLRESSADFKVVALSYTRRAAAELRSRFGERLMDKPRRVETDTLHGFAQRLLIQYGTWIGLPADPLVLTDDADRVDLLQTWRLEAGLEPLENARSKLLDLDVCLARGHLHPLSDEWLAALEGAGALDYGAMLLRATELLGIDAIGNLVARMYRHVIVDEAQNLTFAQYTFLDRLFRCSDTMNAVFVGDDKQSIVEFAGASVEHLRSFEHDFGASVFRLTCNFRSAEAIARLGDAIASQLNEHPSAPQKYAAAGLVQTAVFTDERAEAAAIVAWVRHLLQQGLPESSVSSTESRHVVGRDIAVLARSASALRASEAALSAAGVAVARATHADDWLMSELGRHCWLLGTFRPQSTVSQRRLIRELGISSAGSAEELRNALETQGKDVLVNLVGHEGPATFIDVVSRLESKDEDWFADQRELATAWAGFCNVQPVSNRSWPQFELFVAQWQRGDDEQQGVRLQTVHKSQGREFKAVAIIGLNDGQFPDFRARSKQARESELRAFYVAATRASRCLLLTRPAKIMTRNGSWQRSESPFLRLVRETLE